MADLWAGIYETELGFLALEKAALETYSARLDFFSPIIIYIEKAYDSSKESSIHCYRF